jgi:hypothetical protein
MLSRDTVLVWFYTLIIAVANNHFTFLKIDFVQYFSSFL